MQKFMIKDHEAAIYAGEAAGQLALDISNSNYFGVAMDILGLACWLWNAF